MKLTGYFPVNGIMGKPGVMAKPTGEFRCPKKGEWYLSGAVIEAYKAPNDLSSEYHIAKLVHVKQVTTIVECAQ
jgi:hypothetical protein